jgi:hypothetical protein
LAEQCNTDEDRKLLEELYGLVRYGYERMPVEERIDVGNEAEDSEHQRGCSIKEEFQHVVTHAGTSLMFWWLGEESIPQGLKPGFFCDAGMSGLKPGPVSEATAKATANAKAGPSTWLRLRSG